MKKRKYVKSLWIVLAVGMMGLVLVVGLSIATDAIMSRDDAKVYEIVEPFDTVEFQTYQAQVTMVASQNVSKVDASAKAWLDRPFEMDDLMNVNVDEGVLNITEMPFPAKFLGLFPQPYELIVTLHIPQEIMERMGESQ